MKRNAAAALSAVVLALCSCATIERDEASRRNAAAVRRTSNPNAVAGCEFAANVGRNPLTGESDLPQMIGPDPSVVGRYIVLNGPGVQELYVCKSSGATSASTATPKIRVVGGEDNVRGCVFVAPIDQGIDCPADYPAGTACMAYRAKLQGGNTVLARDGGKVYQCAAQPATTASK